MLRRELEVARRQEALGEPCIEIPRIIATVTGCATIPIAAAIGPIGRGESHDHRRHGISASAIAIDAIGASF